jgi:hypothetical protein
MKTGFRCEDIKCNEAITQNRYKKILLDVHGWVFRLVKNKFETEM